MAEMRAALQSVPLLTLVGPGGVGKTRPALELGRALHSDYHDDVQFVDLTTVPSGALVPQTLASTLKLQSSPQMDLTVTITGALRDREMLLILDNCEHVLADAAKIADELLAHCDHLRLVATSRLPLGVRGESVWPVPPLSISPDVPGGAARTGEWADVEAVRLFVNRAREVQPGFSPGGQEPARLDRAPGPGRRGPGGAACPVAARAALGRRRLGPGPCRARDRPAAGRCGWSVPAMATVVHRSRTPAPS
jgi:predicted ATPase